MACHTTQWQSTNLLTVWIAAKLQPEGTAHDRYYPWGGGPKALECAIVPFPASVPSLSGSSQVVDGR